MGKGQNVENHFVKSQKKNIESLKFEKDQNVERSERRKFEKDQNVKSLICLIFKFQQPMA